MRARIVLAAALAAALVRGPAAAMVPALDAGQTAQARAQGVAFAQRRRGYDDRAYQLFSVPDTLRIARGQGLLDAVLVGTPYERTRYESYFAAFQRKPLTTTQAGAIAAGLRDTVEFVVFVHSATGERDQRTFLQRYHIAWITVNGRRIDASAAVPFGPALDNYNTDAGVVMRWVGSVTYRFDLRGSGLPPSELSGLRGTLTVLDQRATAHRYAFDLNRYR